MGELNINGQIVSQTAEESLIQDLRQIIEQARGHVAATANYEQTMMLGCKVFGSIITLFSLGFSFC